MFNLILILFTLSLLIYVYKIGSCYRGLYRLSSGQNKTKFFVTVLIPARNEERHIATCLRSLVAQDYPRDRFQVIVIDDDSADRTREIVEAFAMQYRFIRLIALGPCPPGVAPKKRALQAGFDAAAGEIIVTTDADAWASARWISQVISYFEPDIGMVIGYVGFPEEAEQNLFQKIQSLEFIGLTMAGIGSLGAGDPIIANGANLAFRRISFEEAGGYRTEAKVISGDDDLLLQKVNRSTRWKIKAAVDPDTFVYTHPMADLPAFLMQRIRWASKGLVYQKPSLVIFLLATYFLYLLLFISIPYALFFPGSFPYPVITFLIKLAVDFLLIFKGTILVDRKDLRRYFLIAEILQIPYILYVGLAGVFKKFEWKGR